MGVALFISVTTQCMVSTQIFAVLNPFAYHPPHSPPGSVLKQHLRDFESYIFDTKLDILHVTPPFTQMQIGNITIHISDPKKL
jgi:hypothetical protein